MMSLFIDTSNFRLIVAVVDELSNKVISYYNEKLSGDLSVKVFDVIQTCIEQANIKPREIEKLYCVTGPGSFTGVRIGVTICKTFAWSLNKKVIPISSLEVLSSTNTNYKTIVGAIDARELTPCFFGLLALTSSRTLCIYGVITYTSDLYDDFNYYCCYCC